MWELFRAGVRVHGFGFKIDGLRRCAGYMVSADSMAWSFQARRLQKVIPECGSTTHKNCANCHWFARKWYSEKILPMVTP